MSVRPLPAGPAVMRQKWKDLLFLHWKWDAEKLQAALPDGLTADTFEGNAWLGVVPFFMCGVRPSLLPPVPFLSNFLELNVRTYVRDSEGNPGVWFFSLDCNQPVAVGVARAFFHLPYFHAKMSAMHKDGMTAYHSCRNRTERQSIYKYRAAALAAPASPGSLEEFLVERYRLFAEAGGQLFSGEVRHAPYTISPATVPEWCAGPLLLAGFDPGSRPPDHALHSPGVDVRVYPLRRSDHAGFRMSRGLDIIQERHSVSLWLRKLCQFLWKKTSSAAWLRPLPARSFASWMCSVSH